MCFYNYIFSINIIVFSGRCLYHTQKGPKIRVSYNNPQANTGIICEADGIPFQWGKKRSSLDENELSVDSGLCYEMTQSEQGAFHRGTPRITHSSLSMNSLSSEKIPLSILLLKTHRSLWRLHLPCRSLSCFSVEGGTRRHELPLVFNLFNYTQGLLLWGGFFFFSAQKARQLLVLIQISNIFLKNQK